MGTSRHFPKYSLETPELVALQINLCSFHGGNRSVAECKQIATDISKFMAYATKFGFKWRELWEEQKLKSYVKLLEETGIGADGICSKLDRLQCGLRYVTREHKHLYSVHNQEIKSALDKLGVWKGSFRSKRLTHAMTRAAEYQDTTDEDLIVIKKPLGSEKSKKSPTKSQLVMQRIHLRKIKTLFRVICSSF